MLDLNGNNILIFELLLRTFVSLNFVKSFKKQGRFLF